jgi:biopolymer transport protein TolR
MSLSPAQRQKIRRLARPKDVEADAHGGELNVVPFLDILMNVLMFVLATLAITFTASVDLAPPRPKPVGPGAPPSGLALHVMVVHDGFAVSAMGKHVAAGCKGEGAGLTVGNAGGAYDYAGLTACVARLKETFPDRDGERGAVIAASPDVPYQTVIATMDALRRSGDRELFPEVSFALPR